MFHGKWAKPAKWASRVRMVGHRANRVDVDIGCRKRARVTGMCLSASWAAVGAGPSALHNALNPDIRVLEISAVAAPLAVFAQSAPPCADSNTPGRWSQFGIAHATPSSN